MFLRLERLVMFLSRPPFGDVSVSRRWRLERFDRSGFTTLSQNAGPTIAVAGRACVTRTFVVVRRGAWSTFERAPTQ